MQFKIPFELPIAQKTVRYHEISNEDYFNILKYISTNDDISIEMMFDDLVQQTTGECSERMYAADKFCLLMDLRSIALGDSIEFKTKSGALVKLRISDILTNIRTFLQGRTFSKHLTTEDVVISIDAPRRFIINSIDTLLTSTISTISDGVHTAAFDDLTESQKDAVLNSLPAELYNQMLDHINSCKSSYNNVYIMQPNSSLGIDEIMFNMFDTTMFEFIKTLYSGDLMNFYELQYSLITKLHISYDHFMKMTPNESRIYINLHTRDIKKQESERTSSTPSGFTAQ